MRSLLSLLSASCLLVLVSGCASTTSAPTQAEPAAEPTVRAEAPRIVDTAEFLVFLDTLEQDLEAGEPRELNRLEMRRVQEISKDLREMLDGVDSIDQLNNNAQTEVYNTTQALWAAVIGRDEDQVICRREHRVGTNFKSTRCRTVSEIREDQSSADRYLRTRGPGPMPALDGAQ
ncbi:hypothetical protein HFP89_04925 [Wenzhouxiangella sp. XN79A]|uniref:hypothetical protein n=1 Tax=Wenzhouxiangella sp. XN79A TaxID=2724193 RepID=UPI00144A672A|nr:hypothetical protein [Wenzhouxiangella sp. XN79A]NKI34506.1 hypothetical protein [Wenzhouxiangella sp. XN79A]